MDFALPNSLDPLEKTPQSPQEQRKRTWFQEAIDTVLPNDHSGTSAMADMCRAAAAIDKARKRFHQTEDPRDTHEVLISEGIEPHPGPRDNSRPKRRAQNSAIDTVKAAAILYICALFPFAAAEHRCVSNPNPKLCSIMKVDDTPHLDIAACGRDLQQNVKWPILAEQIPQKGRNKGASRSEPMRQSTCIPVLTVRASRCTIRCDGGPDGRP